MSQEKLVFEDCYLTTENLEKGHIRGSAAKRVKCCSYKLPDCKFSAEDKKYQLFIPKVTFKERGIECPKLKFTEYFRHGLNQKTRKSKGFNI